MERLTDQQKKDALMSKLRGRQREYLSNPLRMLDPSQRRVGSFLEYDEKSWLDGANLELDVPEDSPPGTVLVATRDGDTINIFDSGMTQAEIDLARSFERRNAQVHANAYRYGR